jgi:hypothetical protein
MAEPGETVQSMAAMMGATDQDTVNAGFPTPSPPLRRWTIRPPPFIFPGLGRSDIFRALIF